MQIDELKWQETPLDVQVFLLKRFDFVMLSERRPFIFTKLQGKYDADKLVVQLSSSLHSDLAMAVMRQPGIVKVYVVKSCHPA